MYNRRRMFCRLRLADAITAYQSAVWKNEATKKASLRKVAGCVKSDEDLDLVRRLIGMADYLLVVDVYEDLKKRAISIIRD